jgi:diacylglycerol kinase (ATP)
MLVAVGNTSSYGGGMHICPDADPTDGLLDVTVIHPVGAAKLLRMLPLMYSGRFARDRSVERLQAERIVIEGPGLVGFGDGELIGATPLTVSSAPKSLRVLVPDRVPWGHHGQRDLRPRRRAEPGTGLRPVPQQPDESGGQGLR